MGRKNLYEVLNELDFDTEKEYDRLWDLINEKKMKFYHTSISLLDYINIFTLEKLTIRGTANSIDDLLEDIELDEHGYSIDHLYLLSEFILALKPGLQQENDEYQYLLDIAIKIFDKAYSNITEICRRTNHEIFDNDGKPIIVEKNKLTSHAVELVDNSALSLSIIEYNHYAMKGHLEEKKSILLQIGSFLEPIFKEHVLQKAGYVKLESDARFLLNNFHIRHNNKDGKSAQEYIVSLSDDELENWYDKVYNTLLSIIIINEQIDIDNELNYLKQNYKWK